MGCACGKNRLKNAKPAGSSFKYEFTPPGGGDVETYLTPLEAKSAVRRAGGGNVRRLTIPAAS